MSEPRRTGWEEAERWFASRGEAAGDSATVPSVPACTVCGAPLEPDQTYCLECGSPTPLAPRLRRGGRNTAIVAGAMIVLGLGAGALAYAMVNDDDPGDPVSAVTTPSTVLVVPTQTTVTLPPTTETAPSTGPLPADTSVTTPTAPILTAPATTATATGFSTVTGPASTPTTAPTTAATTTATTAATTTAATTVTRTAPVPAVGGDSDWPAGRTAWTAVLASVRSEPDARAAKARVAAGGDPAGVLLSTDFSALRSGYWVVFSGIYDSRVTAIAQATKLRGSFPRAYARRIEG